MNSGELLSMSASALGSNKLRSALTLLGMVIGVFAIIVSVTAVEVISNSVVSTVESFGATTFQVYRSSGLQVEGAAERRQRVPDLTYEQAALLAERTSLPAGISPSTGERGVRFRYGGIATEPSMQLIGSTEDWIDNNNRTVVKGRGLSIDDVRYGRPVVILGSSLAKELFPRRDPLGETVATDRGRLSVVGVFEEQGSAFGQDQDQMALTPITTLFSMYGRPNRDLSIDVRAPSMQAMDQTQDEVIGALRVIRAVGPGEDNTFAVSTPEENLSQFRGLTRGVTMGGVAIGLLTLLAAGIGIMNIMLVTVAERTREIGLRKSLGAKRRDILNQFLIEAIILCQIGGVIGVIFGVGVGNVVAVFFDAPFVVPWAWVVVAVVGVTGFALTFGVYPAWRASKLDPIEALRRE